MVHDFVVYQNKLFFFKNSFRNTIRVSNRLDPDQDRRSVGPNLGPNSLPSRGLSRKVVNVHKQYNVIQRGEVFTFMYVFF